VKYRICFGSKFKRDIKTFQKRGFPLDQIVAVFQLLEYRGKLPEVYSPHKLSGNYLNCWECRIRPDCLLIWECNEDEKEIG